MYQKITGFIAVMLFLAACSGAVRAEDVARELHIKREAGLSKKLVYWFVNRDNSSSERRFLSAAPGDDADIVLPARFNHSGTTLKVLDLTNRHIARIPLTIQDSKAVLGPNLLQNSDFKTGSQFWNPETQGDTQMRILDDLDAPPGAPGRAIRFKINSIDDQAYHVQCNQGGLDLREGEPYTFSFWAKADRARSITVASSINEGDYHLIGLNGQCNLTQDWRKYELVFTASHVAPQQNRIGFVLGNVVGAVDLANVELHHGRAAKPLGKNILINGDFEQANGNWDIYALTPAVGKTTFLNGSDASLPATVRGKVARYQVLKPGAHVWDIGFIQKGLDLHEGEPYSVTFWGRADQECSFVIETSLESGDYHPVGLQSSVDLKKEWHKYSFAFTAVQTVKSATRLAYQLGSSKGTIELADISVRPGYAEEAPAAVSQKDVIALAASDFKYAEAVRLPVTYRGKSVKGVTLNLSAGDTAAYSYKLSQSDYGVAQFKEVPVGVEFAITATLAGKTAVYSRTVESTGRSTLKTITLPEDWANVKVVSRPLRSSATAALIGSWENFEEANTLAGKEIQHQLFTFNPDGTITLDVTSVSADPHAPVGPAKTRTFHWSVGNDRRHVYLGDQLYAWSIEEVPDQPKKLTLKGASGKIYTLFRL